MQSLNFPIKMVDGSESNIAKTDRNDLQMNSDNRDSRINNSNDTQDETFADHMQKEPETPASKTNHEHDREEDSTHENHVGEGEKTGIEKVVKGNEENIISKDAKSTIIHFGEVEFTAPAELALSEVLITTPGKESTHIQAHNYVQHHEVAKAELTKDGHGRISQPEKAIPSYQLSTGNDKTEGMPVVQSKTPVTAISIPMVKSSETVVTGVVTSVLTPDAKPAIREIDLVMNEMEVLEKPEIHMGKATKPVITQSTQIAPSTYMLAEGEPELDMKAMATTQETTATTKLMQSSSILGSTAPSASQVTNAAAATAAAQVIAAIKADKNSNNIEVRLDPPELGRVRINFSMETADAVKAVLSVERAETLDHLRRNISQFIEDLKMAGFGAVDIEFSEQGTSEFDQDTGFEDSNNEASFISSQEDVSDIVYLSLRDDAQLNLLV